MLPVAQPKKHRDGGRENFFQNIFIVFLYFFRLLLQDFRRFASGSERGGGLLFHLLNCLNCFTRTTIFISVNQNFRDGGFFSRDGRQPEAQEFFRPYAYLLLILFGMI